MSIKPIVASAFLTAVLFSSCKKELQPQESSNAVANEAKASDTQNVNQQLEVQNQNPQMVQAPNQVQTQPKVTAPGMNPPHGQPNHRCDIADGAPLNSPRGAMPAQQSAPVQTTMPQGQVSNVPAVATPPGMNPPHGQAGHLCEIAVGAPLPKK